MSSTIPWLALDPDVLQPAFHELGERAASGWKTTMARRTPRNAVSARKDLTATLSPSILHALFSKLTVVATVEVAMPPLHGSLREPRVDRRSIFLTERTSLSSSAHAEIPISFPLRLTIAYAFVEALLAPGAQTDAE
jgi:hypothetical protein